MPAGASAEENWELMWHREKMYSQGGVFSITSRILIVDLLSSMSHDGNFPTRG